MEELEEIAIVGIGCRFPGANNIQEFWNVLANGENHVKEIPGDRWNLDAVYDADPDAYGKTYVRRAGLLSNHDVWDNDFFGIAEKEASEMDPQQRYVLECVHMALEDGGITRAELDGSSTSVYIGAMNNDSKTSKDGDYSLLTNYSVTGDAASIITARVSYHYNLLGPSLTIDTACSSSLVAVNLATQSLRIGESSMAICGGVNSILYPDMFVTLTKARMASPTGQCQAFSANADGYARGEGCGIIILERLSDALRNDRQIWATIRTGCNQDGQTAKPITAPSEIQQNRLLHDIYLHSYHIDPSHVQYIEAHAVADSAVPLFLRIFPDSAIANKYECSRTKTTAVVRCLAYNDKEEMTGTGTPIGDPTEVNSLGSFFKDFPIQHDEVMKKRYIGSVKTNIGHLESGAGAASLIKTLLMMKHGKIVPSLHSLPRNPRIDFDKYGLTVPTSIKAWPELLDGSRAACINCFGFGGTNSHAFIRQWVEKPPEPTQSNNEAKMFCVPVSAKSQTSLMINLKHMATKLKEEPCDLKQLAYTASCKRDHYRYRKLFTESSIIDLARSCNNAIDITNSTIKPCKNYRIVYVFCGVGTAWTNMGMELVKDFPVFAETLKSIDTYLASLTGWSITDKIRDGAEMKDPFTSHIGIFACQVGLTNLLKHWGICPDAIVGQSVGEVAAAYSSEALSLRDAIKVIYYRSKFLAKESGGKMIVVRNVSTEKVAKACNKVGHVNIAVHISQVACTVAGGEKQVDEVRSLIEEDAKLTNHIPLIQDLKVNCAYHSQMVKSAAGQVRKCLKGIVPSALKTPVFSTVTGNIATDFGTPEYWERNVSKPVLFYQALLKSTNKTSTVFIELGPKPVLQIHLSDIFKDEDVMSVPSMKSNSGSSQVLTMLSDLYTLGINPQWRNFVPKTAQTTLPQYQFDGRHLMVESDYRFLRKKGLMDDTSSRYLMLTKKGEEGKFKVNISPQETPFVYDHVIDGVVIIPGAVYTEVAFEIGMSLMGKPAECMHVEYDIVRAISLSKGKPFYLDVTTIIKETNNNVTNVEFSISKEEITVAKGFVTNGNHTHTPIIPVEDVCVRSGRHTNREEIYSELAKHGYQYGPSVQILESITYNNDECTGYIHLTDEVERQINQTSFHPAILDAMLHSSALIFLSDKKGSSYKIYPIRLGNVSVFRSFEKRMVCYTRIIQEVYDRSITNIILTRPDGLVLAEIKEIEHQVMDGSMGVNTMAYQICWTTEDISSVINDTCEEAKPKVTICSDDNGVHNILRTRFPQGESFLFPNTEDDLDSLMFSIDDENADLVIFTPGSNAVQQVLDSNFVFNNVCKSCEAFLKIMKRLKDTEKVIIVVTENTQDSGKENKVERNIFGSELWGFTRSLRQEGIRCRMILVDVQPSIASEVETLHNTITFLMSANASSIMECLIVDGQIQSNFLQRRQQRGLQIQHRMLSTDTRFDLYLRSTRSDRIERPFLIPGDRQCGLRKNVVTIQVDEICIHSPSVFCVTELDARLKNYLWTDYVDGYPVIGLEFLGTILGPKQLRRVVSCFPMRVANRISVPKQCVCDITSFRPYTPGLITKAMTMWSIMQRVEKKSDVCIITGSVQSENTVATLLLDMLQTVKHCRVHITSICYLNDARYLDNDVFVLFQKFSQDDIACVLRSGIVLIGFDDEMSFLTSQVFQMSAKDIGIIAVKRSNTFTMNITTTFSKVTRWLKRHPKRYILSDDTGGLLPTIRLNGAKSADKLDIKTKAMENKLFYKNATYVVVGGLTGLGWEIVKWLGYQGAGIVVTLSRKGHNPQMKEQIQNAMDIHKYEIIPTKCDVSNYADVKKTFDEIRIQFPYHPIKGIFQGAGVLRDTRTENMTMDKFKEVLQPKVLGTWNLHLVSKGLLLDFFVMHSSTTSVFGNAGQTNYGAANSFLDSLAFYRRAKNLPGQTINWGALSVGMANDEKTRNILEAQGFYVLETEEIKECLKDSLIRNPCQIVYGRFDWNIIGKNPSMMRTSASASDEIVEARETTGQRRVVNTLLDQSTIMEEPFEEQRKTITRLLFNIISKVLSIDVRELDENLNLLSLGMESQKAVELIQLVKEATGCRLPVAYILSPNQTIGILIDFVHTNIIDNAKMNATETSAEVKNDVHGSPSWMEKLYIDMCNNNAMDTSLWFSTDFKLGRGLSNVKTWQTVLRWITIRNPELRTLYQQTDNQLRFGMKKIVLDPEDAKIDLRCVDSRVMTRMTDKDIVKYCSFDITKDPPLRTLYCNKGKNHRIRFIISHVSFDLQSFFTLVPQLHRYLRAYILKNDVTVQAVEALDIAVLMEERINADRFYLENYWKGELNKICGIPSINGAEKDIQLSEKTEKLTMHLPKELVDKINDNDYGVTTPFFLLSLYQIILQKMTSVHVVPVVMVVDMRRHFPQFNDRIFLGTNYIPVITEFKSPILTLQECIELCSKQAIFSIENSLYPFELIKQLHAKKQNCFRHFFNVRDIPMQLAKPTQNSRYYMESVGYVTGFLNQIETALNVVTDRKTGLIELVLSYDSKSISSSQANRMLNDVSILACATLTNSDLQLNEVPLECCWTTYASAKMDKYLSTVIFMKETTQGWEHPAQLMLNVINNVPKIAWVHPDESKGSLRGEVPIKCVLDVDIARLCDLWCLIIQTTNRRYCFKTSDYFMVQALKARIRNLMSSNTHILESVTK
ncbi:uncharacterized protein LOC132561871 [Ylistrum balloti]|uniref:uncharacterized protein LOC132561871 n=1 Tax=Ylistrum balloti TaxID=509963 RepID=UPI0029058606|nr:uncharacterized protein LOC132561871 [Ylistrum balloti]